jgi:hypothetical protein
MCCFLNWAQITLGKKTVVKLIVFICTLFSTQMTVLFALRQHFKTFIKKSSTFQRFFPLKRNDIFPNFNATSQLGFSHYCPFAVKSPLLTAVWNTYSATIDKLFSRLHFSKFQNILVQHFQFFEQLFCKFFVQQFC